MKRKTSKSSAKAKSHKRPRSLSEMEKQYSWKKGCGTEFTALDPSVAAAELERIRQKKNGSYKAVDIVEASRDPSNPFHEIFEWDNPGKWEQFGREQFAQRLIRSLHVTIITPERTEITTRVTFSRPVPHSIDRVYDSQIEMMSDDEGREVILRQAWRQIIAWKRRYSQLSELAKVCDLIDIEYARFKSS